MMIECYFILRSLITHDEHLYLYESTNRWENDIDGWEDIAYCHVIGGKDWHKVHGIV